VRLSEWIDTQILSKCSLFFFFFFSFFFFFLILSRFQKSTVYISSEVTSAILKMCSIIGFLLKH